MAASSIFSPYRLAGILAPSYQQKVYKGRFAEIGPADIKIPPGEKLEADDVKPRNTSPTGRLWIERKAVPDPPSPALGVTQKRP